jgi:hypothetical protein
LHDRQKEKLEFWTNSEKELEEVHQDLDKVITDLERYLEVVLREVHGGQGGRGRRKGEKEVSKGHGRRRDERK